MTPQEVHIAIDLGLQYVNANIQDIILPEEKDWFFNDAATRFVRNRVNPKSNVKREGFEDTVKRYEDLESIIEYGSKTLYINSNEANCMSCYKPYNLLSLVNDRSSLRYNCEGLTATIASTPASYCIVPFPTATNLYVDYKLRIDNNTIADVTVFDMATAADSDALKTAYPTGINPKLKFIIINQVLERVNREFSTYCEVYWERWNNKYAQNSFIFVFNTYDATWVVKETKNGVAEISIASTSVNLTSYSFTGTDKLETTPNRLTDHEVVHNMLVSHYNKTKYTNPISTMNKGYINVFHDSTFIPVTLKFNYIRKPRKQSYLINQSIDISENFHQEIVDMTVQRIKALLQANNYKEFVNENLLTE